jgi:tetratricopeptide (TPR) repeat protein
MVSAAGANQTESNDGDGSFALVFPGKEPGDRIRLMVSKPRYVVVNEFQLDNVLPKDVDAEPLVIVICREEEREGWARILYRLKGEDANQATYERKLKELPDTQRDTALAKLRIELDQANAAADKAAEELARIRPNESSELYAEASSLFLNGKIPEALEVLNEHKLAQAAAAAKEQKEQAEKAIAETVQDYLLRARLLTTQFRFDEAEKSYRAAIEISPDSFDAHAAFGYFNEGLNRHWQARIEAEKSRSLAHATGNKAGEAGSIENLGVLDHQEGEPIEARKKYNDALSRFEELDKQNPGAYLADIAGIQGNLGTIDEELGGTKDALGAYNKALDDLRKLNEQNSGAYSQDLARTLNNLGTLYLEEGQTDDAARCLEESLDRSRQIAQQNRETYSPEVGRALINMGILSYMQNCALAARLHLDGALEIFRYLNEKNQETYSPLLATTLEAMGVFEMGEKQLDPARQHIEEALNIRIRLNRRDSLAYSPALAESLRDLGILDWKQNRIQEALLSLHRAKEIYEHLALGNPWKFDMKVTYVNNIILEIEYGPFPSR